jgi:hypothetical protein
MNTQQHEPAVRVSDTEVDVIVDVDIKQMEEDNLNDIEMDDHARKVMEERWGNPPNATKKGYRKTRPAWDIASDSSRHLTSPRRGSS